LKGIFIMVASVRGKDFINNTGALLPFGDPKLLFDSGQDYGFQSLAYIFSASELGTNANQTRDTATNPRQGFLMAQFKGTSIRQVCAASLRKDSVVSGTTFRSQQWATAGQFTKLSFRVVNPDAGSAALPNYNPDYASLYVLDEGSDAANQIAAGDAIYVTLELGNSLGFAP
jgi:hypothetical protein